MAVPNQCNAFQSLQYNLGGSNKCFQILSDALEMYLNITLLKLKILTFLVQVPNHLPLFQRLQNSFGSFQIQVVFRADLQSE